MGDRSNHPLDLALAEAIRFAAQAGRWDVVMMLARQLEARDRMGFDGALRVVPGVTRSRVARTSQYGGMRYKLQ